MKIANAARFSGVARSAAALYTLLIARTGLRVIGVPFPRQAWLLEHGAAWQIGSWLWLVAIFSWMLLVIVISWSYLPAHRVATMLQGGLTISAAVLAICGVIVWMAVLPAAFAQTAAASTLVPLVDALAFGLLGAAFMMAGAVTAWQVIDLHRLQLFPPHWLLPPLCAGLLTLPSPFLLPNPLLLFGSLFCWLVWCGWLATRPRLPSPFAEYPGR